MNIYIILIIELLFLSLSILLLFRFRSKLGLAPLFILLGTIQYLQAFSSTIIRFEIFGEYTVYPGSVIIFSGVLFAVLLIYIKEGVASARALIIGIIISNFLLSALSGISYVQEGVLELINGNSTNSVFSIDYKLFITGTIILLFDFILLVILYQFLITKISKLYFFLILFIALATVLVFDSLVFNLILKYNDPELFTSLIGHFIGKTVAAFIFSLILYIYIKYIDKEKDNVSFIANQSRDIFSIIRLRKKYKSLTVQKEKVEKKLVSQIESTLKNISDGFVSLDTNWHYTYVNIKAGEYLGRSPESLIGKHIWTEFPDGVGLPFYNVYYKAVETQQTQYFQEYYEPFDKWFENRIYPSADGLTIYFTDITEKKKAEANNQMLLSLIETSDDFIGLASLEGKPIYLNVLGRKTVGLEVDEALPANIIDFFPEDYHDAIVKEHMANIFNNSKWNGEVQFKNFKTGDLIPIEMAGFLIKDAITNNPLALGIVASNITERKNAEALLIKSENLFRQLTSSAPVAIFQTDKDGSCNYVNEEWVKYSGLSPEEGMGFGWANAIHPDDKERVMNEWQQAVLSSSDFLSELRFQDKNNKTTWLSSKAVGIYDAQNTLYGYIGIAIDITDRKRAEMLVIKNEKYLDNIINNIGDPMFVKDDQHRLLMVNDAFCKIFNLSSENIIGKTLAEDVPLEEMDEFLRIDKEVLATGVENINEESLTVRGGATRIISTKKTRFIDDDAKKFLIGIIRDITERKRAEDEITKYRDHLEELVKMRTEEVSLKNNELQRMNKLFVGRELKMKELKTIIKEMQLKNDN